ncbi:MAG: ATP-dependent RNA helicase HrpA [Synoicihabitans sp.]
MRREAFTLRPFLKFVPDQKPFPFRLEFPPDLPISAREGEIVDAIQAHPVVILAGETGSGKTTQIPKLCLAAGRGSLGRIACTQPRRVAALSVSRRVAEEMNVGWGREVGCKVRFEDRTSRATTVKFMTDGMLLAEVQSDPKLREYDTIIIDEAHERSLNIDFLLGHLRQLRHQRADLRIVITSATIDTAAFSKAFEDAPVIEVSGRTFPVEVIYQPLNEFGEGADKPEEEKKRESLHYIDGAIEATRRILSSTASGDVLVFMPAERDIRETIDGLGGQARGCDLIPLFGRLSNAEQQRVFAATARRRVIVATNIAETSLTLPGIRYVVDTGLARVSRYSPQSRTRRLPIEAVAQSSADQRKGRAGRVAEGVCIRLYSEKDYNERPKFAQPEIQRSNLADVILRMKAFGLGDIERFPFLNMPASKAIKAGYALLDELHAIESEGAIRRLTDIGRELARLPVDPSVGRMILQARHEKALREVVIIAAGLSVQDPRERPLEKQAAADAAHRRFTHRESDFLTLLSIWETLHDEFEKLSQSKMRRWCRDHFLSYARLREWRDIHHQLNDVLRERKDLGHSSVWDGTPSKKSPAEATDQLVMDDAAFRAIHRSILAGLLGNIANRDDENAGYKATHDRKPVIFPGSGLFVREEKKKGKGGKPQPASTKGKARSPRWLMSAEFMETSRLYARTCARLDPRWVLDLGSHLLQRSYREPFWDEEKGRVMVRQRTRLYGLEVESREVSYGKINPAEATDIFIREALVNDTIKWPFDFLSHNRAVRTRVENQLTRTRDRGVMNLDQAVWQFYHGQLVDAGYAVSAVGELIALVKEHRAHEPEFLQFEADDLQLVSDDAVDASAYPESLPLGTSVLPLNYLYKPGDADDGVTLEVDVAQAELLTQGDLDWAVPGHLEAKIEHYLRALPKDLRRAVMPLAATARKLVPDLRAADRNAARRMPIADLLAKRLGEQFGLNIRPAVWADRPVSEHLQVRVQVTDDAGTEIVASRSLAEIQAAVAAHQRKASREIDRNAPKLWRQARQRWETEALDEWPREAIPVEIEIGQHAGVVVKAYPGFAATRDGVVLRLYRSLDDAMTQGHRGLRAMLNHMLRRDLAWMEKDLKALKAIGPLASSFYAFDDLKADAVVLLTAWLTDPNRVPAVEGKRTKIQFDKALQSAKEESRKAVPILVDRLRVILELRQKLVLHPTPYPGLAADVGSVVGPRFLANSPYEQLQHFERYLRARLLRADRWKQAPEKDAERVRLVAPFLAALSPSTDDHVAERLRWLIEEFRVSLWAQKLGTAEPVSAKKLREIIASQSSEKIGTKVGKPKPPPAPLSVTPLPGKTKKKPLKSLNALGGLFRPPGS